MWPITSFTPWARARRSSSGTATRRASSPMPPCPPGSSALCIWAASLSGDGSGLSPHLRSRAEVGDILLGSGVPTAALQAAVIIGSGSASFEMLRYLTERLPVMVTPKWVGTRIQPIAARDVLRYLVGCAALPPDVNRRFDIGGPDVLTYAEMMRRYSEVAGLRPRVLIPVPLLTPRLSSLWVGLVTPVPAGLAMPLVESLRNEVVCSEHDIASYVPDPPEGLVPLDRAIALALRHTREGAVSTRWSSAATPGAPSDPLPSDPPWAGGSLYVDARSSRCPRFAGRTMAGHRGHRRRDRVVFLPRRVGTYAGCSTGSAAASGCAADAVIRGTCSSATRWISGG